MSINEPSPSLLSPNNDASHCSVLNHETSTLNISHIGAPWIRTKCIVLQHTDRKIVTHWAFFEHVRMTCNRQQPDDHETNWALCGPSWLSYSKRETLTSEMSHSLLRFGKVICVISLLTFPDLCIPSIFFLNSSFNILVFLSDQFKSRKYNSSILIFLFKFWESDISASKCRSKFLN